MEYVTHSHDPARSYVVEPQKQTGDKKEHGTQRDKPEVKLLPAVEESDVFSFYFLLVRNVGSETPHPSSIRVGPTHWSKPIQELKKKHHVESQPKPRVQESRHRTTAKKRRQPAIEPRRIDCKTREQRKNKSDCHRPVQHPGINRMT